MPEKITIRENRLEVPNHPIIPFIIGDGIGPDIWKAAVRVFDAAVGKAHGDKRKIAWKEVLAGQKAFDETGEWLPEDTLKALEEHLVSIKGPLTTPVGEGIRSLNVTIRQRLDLYACQRPIHWFEGVPTPVKNPQHAEMVIFRENTEDIYAGIEFMGGSDEAEKLKNFLIDELKVEYDFPLSPSLGIKPVSRQRSERLIRAAINYAIIHELPTLTLVHKGNIMKFTEGAFKKWGYELAESEFHDKVYTWHQWEATQAKQGEDVANEELQRAKQDKKLIINDIIADNFLQQIIINPQNYSVIATLNLNGDYVSDALAAIVGGIGIAPGANINFQVGTAVFEATHGTAPRFANTDTLNPSSLILSGVMMFEYLGWTEVAMLIKNALSRTILAKKVTIDFYNQMEDATLLKTSEFGDAIIQNMD